ncbi:MAG: SPOR domain-containing protein [Candidatus Dadabacteria bacterium]|nr:SPOR domain-containing protein [Candidatus Dadabacteria bacterium]MCZ6864220.1 SPOR domain-containing protein [Candidatus Dadabacteria bacterium]
MSNNSGTNNSKIISLFITFAVLFIVVFSLGVIIGKGLGGSDTQTIERSYDEDVSSEKFSEPELVGEGSIVQDSNLTEIESKELVVDEETEIGTDDVPKQSTADQAEVVKTDDNADTKTPSEKPQSNELSKESDSQSNEETEPLKVSIEKSPLENQSSTPAKSAMPKIDPSGRYTVQIGAFQDQSQANRLLNSMKSKGYPAFIKQMESPDNKRWYRVRVGTFSTRDDALSYGDKIKEKESRIKSVFITVNN